MAEVLRGGNQDRAVANDLIIPAPRHEPESHLVPVFCAEPERSVPMRDWTPDQFTVFDQACPSRQHKRELRQGYQEDVWREITATRDAVFDIVSYGGTRSTPPYSLWTLIDLLEAHSWLTPYLHPLLPLAETYQEATGAVFVLDGKFNSAELYTTPALFRQLWPKLCSSRIVSIFNAPPGTVHIADKVPGPPVFFSHGLQHPVLEQRFGFASSSSSLFSRSSSLSLRASAEIHLAERPLPALEAYLRELGRPAPLQNAPAPVGVPEDADLVLGRGTLAFHRVWVLPCDPA